MKYFNVGQQKMFARVFVARGAREITVWSRFENHFSPLSKIYLYIHINLSIYMYIYIHIYIHKHTYIYIYIFIYIHNLHTYMYVNNVALGYPYEGFVATHAMHLGTWCTHVRLYGMFMICINQPINILVDFFPFVIS